MLGRIVRFRRFGLDRAYANTRTTARSALVKCSVLRYAFPNNQQIAGGPKLFSSCIITLNSFSNNGTIGVAALVVLGLVGDRPDDVTTGEADGSAKGCECGNKHRHDDADDFDICFHFFGSFRLTMQK